MPLQVIETEALSNKFEAREILLRNDRVLKSLDSMIKDKHFINLKTPEKQTLEYLESIDKPHTAPAVESSPLQSPG